MKNRMPQAVSLSVLFPFAKVLNRDSSVSHVELTDEHLSEESSQQPLGPVDERSKAYEANCRPSDRHRHRERGRVDSSLPDGRHALIGRNAK
jgi:hypothetical protein